MLSQIRAEARKLGTIRGPWLLLAAGPLVVVAGITGLVTSGGNVHDQATADRALAHVGLAAVFALVFGILAVAGEYRHQTITDTYLSCPRRRDVILAKLAVYGLAGAGPAWPRPSPRSRSPPPGGRRRARRSPCPRPGPGRYSRAASPPTPRSPPSAWA